MVYDIYFYETDEQKTDTRTILIRYRPRRFPKIYTKSYVGLSSLRNNIDEGYAINLQAPSPVPPKYLIDPARP